MRPARRHLRDKVTFPAREPYGGVCWGMQGCSATEEQQPLGKRETCLKPLFAVPFCVLL